MPVSAAPSSVPESGMRVATPATVIARTANASALTWAARGRRTRPSPGAECRASVRFRAARKPAKGPSIRILHPPTKRRLSVWHRHMSTASSRPASLTASTIAVADLGNDAVRLRTQCPSCRTARRPDHLIFGPATRVRLRVGNRYRCFIAGTPGRSAPRRMWNRWATCSTCINRSTRGTRCSTRTGRRASTIAHSTNTSRPFRSRTSTSAARRATGSSANQGHHLRPLR